MVRRARPVLPIRTSALRRVRGCLMERFESQPVEGGVGRPQQRGPGVKSHDRFLQRPALEISDRSAGLRDHQQTGCQIEDTRSNGRCKDLYAARGGMSQSKRHRTEEADLGCPLDQGLNLAEVTW